MPEGSSGCETGMARVPAAVRWSASRSMTSCPNSRNCSGSRAALSRSSVMWSSQRVLAGQIPADDERVDVVRALVGVDRLEVEHVADHGVLRRDAVAPVHLAGQPGALERHAHVVAFRHADLREVHLAGVLELTQ